MHRPPGLLRRCMATKTGVEAAPDRGEVAVASAGQAVS